MTNDAVLRSSVICLGAVVIFIGFYTYSFKKMMVTYVFGMIAIAGVLLPDWEFFDRDISQWTSPMPMPMPMPGDNRTDDSSSPKRSNSKGFRLHPVRWILYTTVYSFGLYKWWVYISS